MRRVDAVVIGAGLGGLGAALRLAEAGREVVVLEALTYPGGCASTFSRGGLRPDAGATLLGGLGPSGFLTRWLAEHGEAVPVRPVDPAITLRGPEGALALPARPEALRAALCEAFPGQARGISDFLALQDRLGGALWDLLDHPERLPPLRGGAWLRHLQGAATWLPALPWLGRPLLALAQRHGLDQGPLRTWLDAACQITVQCAADEAEAVPALGALSFLTREPVHAVGGTGALADAFVRALRRRGVTIAFADRATGLAPVGSGWEVCSRSGAWQAPWVFANLLPEALAGLAPALSDHPRLRRLDAAVKGGFGAVALYLGVQDGSALPREAFHWQLVDDPALSLVNGNHALLSVSAADERDRAPAGQRVATLSTHLRMAPGRPPEGEEVARVQERLRGLLSARAPEIEVRSELPASPRTFARFTRRPGGWVGGPPRRAGLGAWRDLWPRPLAPGLMLVGDSNFPGQSALAAAIGGHRGVSAMLGEG